MSVLTRRAVTAALASAAVAGLSSWGAPATAAPSLAPDAPAAAVTTTAPADVSPIAVALDSDGSAYVRGTDGVLYRRSITDEQGGWRRVPGAMTSGPAAVTYANRLSAIFSRGPGDVLQYRTRTGNSFDAWTSLGGRITTAPSAALVTDGDERALVVVARGTDGACYLRVRDSFGTWQGWQRLGGVLTAAPAVGAVDSDGGFVVSARGTDGALYQHRSRVGDDIHPGFVRVSRSPALGSAPARDDVSDLTWYRTAGGALAFVTTTGTVAGDPVGLGGALTSAPSVFERRTTEIAIIARGTDGQVYLNWYVEGSAQGWRSLGGQAA